MQIIATTSGQFKTPYERQRRFLLARRNTARIARTPIIVVSPSPPTPRQFEESAFRRGSTQGVSGALNAIEGGATFADLSRWCNRLLEWRAAPRRGRFEILPSCSREDAP